MPPKKNPETPEKQSRRFRDEARKLIKSGELDPDAGEAAIDGLLRSGASQTKSPPESGRR